MTASSHTAPQLKLDLATGMVSMPAAKGYCSTKASHGVEWGRWYFEAEVLAGAVRVGWGQALAELQAPVGYDEFSYGISNKHAALMHCCRRIACEGLCFPAAPYTIGCLIELPAAESECELLTLDEQKAVIEEKYPPFHFNQLYHVRQEAHRHAQVRFFVQGVPVQEHFSSIYRAKYFPMVSIFGDGQVLFKLHAAQFRFPIPAGAKAMGDSAE